MPKTLTKRKPKTTKEVRQKPKASASFVSNKYKNFQLYPNEPVYAEGFGPEPKLVKFLTTEVPPTYTGIFSLLTAFSLVLLFGNTIIQPKPTNIAEVIQTANIQTIKTNQIVAGGAPLKWTKLIKQSDITNTSHLLKLPKESTQIKVETITQQQATNLQQQPIQQLTLAEKNQLAISNQNNNLFFASILDSLGNLGKYFTGALKDGVDKFTKDDDEEKEKKEKEEKEEKVEKTEDAVVVDLIEEVVVPPVVEAPAPVEAPVVEETPAEIPVEEVPLEFPVEETPLEIVEETTVVEEIPVVEQTSEIQDYVAVTYETPAPIITEQDTDTGKVVTVKGGTTECESILHQNSLLSNITNAPASLFNAAKNLFSNLFTYIQKYLFASLEDAVNLITGGSNDTFVEPAPEPAGDASLEARSSNLEAETAYQECLATHAQLTDILASTKIPEIYKVGQENKIKIKWTNENDKDVSFHAYDTDGNNKLDYVEWTVPHLSEQIFEIIFISKAFELDQDQNIISDIYETVAVQDDIYASVVQNNYVRVTFEQILNSTKDITMYMKPTAGSVPTQIEVYPVYTDVDGNMTQGPQLETVADGQNPDFSNIDHSGKYRILLTNLQTPTSVFDLKITPANAE